MPGLEVRQDNVGPYRIPLSEHGIYSIRKMGGHWRFLSGEMTLFMRIILNAVGE